MRRHVLLLLLLALPASAKSPTLPAGATATQIEIDDAGNGYLAGLLDHGSPNGTYLAFVMKYRVSDGETIYLHKITALDPSKSANANAIAIDSSGALYVTGLAVKDTLIGNQPFRGLTALDPADVAIFAAKIAPNGDVVYATQFGPGVGNDITVNSAGEAYITGTASADLLATPGAAVTDANLRQFVAKLSATGDQLLLVERGIGGGQIALDPIGNIFVSGSDISNSPAPVTPGAFQTAAPNFTPCASIGFLGYLPCPTQHVAKLDPTGSKLLYSTFLNGTYGATPRALAVDDQGNAIIAGFTNSEDFPTTAGVIGPVYRAHNAPRSPAWVGKVPPIIIPAISGFVTKLNNTGTGLIFSTYFSGGVTDLIWDMRFRDGQIYLGGSLGSADLPGTTTVAQQCLPLGFVTRLSADGRTVNSTSVLPLNAAQSIAVDAKGLVYATLFDTIDLKEPEPLTTCVADAASLQVLSSVSPGQIISFFGTSITSGDVATGQGNTLPTSLGNLTVSFDGIPANLLYASPQQANIVVPYEIAGKASVTMEYAKSGRLGSSTRTIPLAVTPRAPFAFEAWKPVDYCNHTDQPLLYPVAFALNEDGSVNTCKNPAAPGSVVTLFINAGGVPGTAVVSGQIAGAATPVNLSVSATSAGQPLEVVRFSLDPGSVNSVWRLDLRMPQRTRPIEITPRIDGVYLLQNSVAVWLKD